MLNSQKCAIIGCGMVGSSIAFTLMQSGLFSELVLIDSNHERAEGEAMDLSHCLPFSHPAQIIAGHYEDLTNACLIIITAGAAQRPDETRLELLHRNAETLSHIISQIQEVHAEGILLIVSNPVDVMTRLAIELSDFPANRVIGSGTVLDTARLKYLLGKQLGVDSRSVHAFIIGEHGDSELAVWSSANISGVDLDNFCKLSGRCNGEILHQLYEEVRDSAYEVIERKGATYYGIAMAVLRIARAIIRDEHSVLPVSCMVSGQYGLNGICIGVPAVLGSDGIEAVLEIELSPEEQERLHCSAKTLQSVLEDLSVRTQTKA